MVCILFALVGYTAFMNINPVINSTLIIRSQAEYSLASQTVSVRYILEVPATGQHRGFIDLEELISALRGELITVNSGIIPPEQGEGKP